MATANLVQPERVFPKLGSWVGLLGIGFLHVAAFAAVFFQLGWIIPVYSDALESARGPLTNMTLRSLELYGYFQVPAFQWGLLGVLVVDLLVLVALFRFRPGRITPFSIYSHLVLAGAIAFLVWNSLALCLGLARL
jgi:hypothetical protein